MSTGDRARAAALQFAVALLLATASGCGGERGGNVPAIRAAFEALPDVHVVDVWGYDDFLLLPPEDIKADLEIGATRQLRCAHARHQMRASPLNRVLDERPYRLV